MKPLNLYWRLFIVWIIASPVITTVVLYGQEQQLENLVKAGFVEKFTRFIDWHSLENPIEGEFFVIGYYRTNPFGEALHNIFSQITIDGKPVIIRRLKNIEESTQCQVLIIPDIPVRELKKILKLIATRPVLTISNTNGFCDLGVLINLYQSEDGYIRFEINHGAFLQSGLKVDSRLFKLARIINWQNR